MGLLHSSVMAVLPLVPRALMLRISSRYIAGETLDEAIARLSELAGRGHSGILDILGEEVEDERAAREVVEEYVVAAERLNAEKLDAYISVKPTHVGLRLGEELALELYRELQQRCAAAGRFLRVEMEDHTTTDATLRLFEALRADSENVGIVLQSRLRRTPADIDALRPGPLSVRLVKGIYLEPEGIAHTQAEPIRRAFVECARQLFERGAFVSLATHDADLADRLIALIRELRLGPDRYEFQVLLGVRTRLWGEWKRAGHPVRVYVPFGPNWRAYSTRRLRKNPQILSHVMGDFFSLRGR